MDRGQGSIAAGCRIAAVSALALFASGCALGVATSAGFGSAVNIGLFLGVASGATIGGEMDPDRRVNEQDCSKPVKDTSANLHCR